MQPQLKPKSAILAVILGLIFVIAWEIYLRNKGYEAYYDDGPELWSVSRAGVYEPADKATVFIGSSRIKYDLDISTWQSITHQHAIQLAMVASSPRHILTDLAADPDFKGKLIIDVTEGLFFSKRGNSSPDAGIAYYRKRTPAQKVSFILNKPLETSLVFLNEDQFSLNGLLNRLPIADRPGAASFRDFPLGFRVITIDRQNKMTNAFLADTNQINRVRAIWSTGARTNKIPPLKGNALDTIMQSVKADIDKIRARGGKVVFTRTPSSGPYLTGEKKNYPRKDYWDRLLAITGCTGIHYADFPATASMICPEWSHLSPKDAVIFTKTLIDALKKNTDWEL